MATDAREPREPIAAERDFGTEPSPFERTYRGLLRGIYEGRFVPGQRLIAPDLMLQFEVGRGTIREVLNRLASSGVVTIVPNRGAQVRTLSRQDSREVLDIVQVLLGLGAKGACRAVAASEKAAMLSQRYETLRQHEWSDDFPGFLQAREDYYRSVIALSGNRELQRLFPTVQVHILRIQLRNFNRAADSMHFADYGDMTRAILSGDADDAQASAHRHVQNTIEAVEALPERAFSGRT